jgi:hypothetical protein
MSVVEKDAPKAALCFETRWGEITLPVTAMRETAVMAEEATSDAGAKESLRSVLGAVRPARITSFDDGESIAA